MAVLKSANCMGPPWSVISSPPRRTVLRVYSFAGASTTQSSTACANANPLLSAVFDAGFRASFTAALSGSGSRASSLWASNVSRQALWADGGFLPSSVPVEAFGVSGVSVAERAEPAGSCAALVASVAASCVSSISPVSWLAIPGVLPLGPSPKRSTMFWR